MDITNFFQSHLPPEESGSLLRRKYGAGTFEREMKSLGLALWLCCILIIVDTLLNPPLVDRFSRRLLMIGFPDDIGHGSGVKERFTPPSPNSGDGGSP
ncbi:hypothetical protein L484_007620 [Morus notabilis]|uniref:Uncharacterized protein n=1 Tax=Morus notabilis TaxID=981085 RepID=W9QI93_9ROSA|nr:hypothetical protein L484_007620 [Morus notabilis]